jgi:hypothetical protein
MALTYEESGTLMNDFVFRNRVKVACLSYASYIQGEAPTTPAHVTRVKWAQNTLISPDQAATNIQPVVVMDPAVLADGSGITDVALQSAVENSVNKIL